ncbi:hypothetical protein BDL97_10G053000 [Sphagnum fallax]|nr:hypothetical protein BDL97_10G053000 [Sphagnum fallax]
MATTARAPCTTTPTLIPSWFSVSRDEAAAACSTSSGSVHFTLPSSPRFCRVCAAHPQLPRPNTGNKACPSLLRASGLSSSASWEGRSHLVHLLSSLRVKGDRQSRKSAAGRVQASLLGVGAPEALVIGVVALLVFGPKGLAEVARTLGKSLRSFQPAIRELQQVSKEFKSTLEQEIGLDELRNPSQPPTTSTPPAPPPFPQSSAPLKQDEPKAYTTEDYLRITEEQANALVSEEQRKAAEAAAWGGQPPLKPTVDIKDPEDAVGEQEGIKDGTSIDKLSNVSQSSGLNS